MELYFKSSVKGQNSLLSSGVQNPTISGSLRTGGVGFILALPLRLATNQRLCLYNFGNRVCLSPIGEKWPVSQWVNVTAFETTSSLTIRVQPEHPGRVILLLKNVFNYFWTTAGNYPRSWSFAVLAVGRGFVPPFTRFLGVLRNIALTDRERNQASSTPKLYSRLLRSKITSICIQDPQDLKFPHSRSSTP